MKRIPITLLLCALGGCASRPEFIEQRGLTCGAAMERPYVLREPVISMQVSNPMPPPRDSLRDDMTALVRAGKLKQALALGETRRAQKELELDAGNGDALQLAILMSDIGELHQALRHTRPAEAAYLRSIALYDSAPLASPEMLRPAVNLAMLYRSQGKSERALALQREAYPKLLAWLGPEHPDVVESEGELARLYLRLKRYKDAADLFQARLERATLAGDKVAIHNNRKALAAIRSKANPPRAD